MSDVRIDLTIRNASDETIICRKMLCRDIDGLNVGDKLTPNQESSYTATTNERIYCLWQGMISGTEYQLAMWNPSHDNATRAAGYGSAGLQPYKNHGTPVDITFKIGSKDLADWGHDNKYTGEAPEFGDC